MNKMKCNCKAAKRRKNLNFQAHHSEDEVIVKIELDLKWPSRN